MSEHGVVYTTYKDETQIEQIKALMDVDLSEPYSVYTYRYFLNEWPQLTYLAHIGDEFVGAIVCKCDVHQGKTATMRGYIAMLAVEKEHRKKGIATELAKKAIEAMKKEGCEEIVLETELLNTAALRFYERLGFVKDKRLHKYYLNQGCAYRLKLYLNREIEIVE
ncbi:hypothetical protein ABK040_010683 [Willaertia magna]